MMRNPLIPAESLTNAAAGSIDTEALETGLKRAGVDADAAMIAALSGETTDHARRVQLEQQERATLAALGQPTYEIPMVSDAAELSGLHDIAQRLQDQGMV
jgi:hypothetical protein